MRFFKEVFISKYPQVCFFFLLFYIGIASVAVSADDTSEKKFWKTELEAGYSMNDGNTQNENLFASWKSLYENKVHEFSLHSDAKFGKSDGKSNEERFHANLKYDRMIDTKISVFTFSDAEKDRFKKLNIRVSNGAGSKFTFIKDHTKNISFSAAVLYEFEENIGERKGKHLARFSFRPKIIWQIEKNVELALISFYQPKVQESYDYRIHSIVNFTVKSAQSLGIRVSVVHKYNNIPVESTKHNDLSFMTSLVFSF